MVFLEIPNVPLGTVFTETVTYLFYVIYKMSAINCCIEFISVVNYIKAVILTGFILLGMKRISFAFLRISLNNY